ncbi:MAG: hypothetical protein LBU99_04920, partial [Spirochaetaceae bacterium]|nr:hypothetical protein [Spirochaetaceae bacterium]
VPIDEREFSNEEYNRVFPRGTVSTPIGEVKIGQNQFSKLSEKDGGNRRGLIGAMKQTLSDPVVIIQERKEEQLANIFIKSFTATENKPISFILSVVVTIEGILVAISTYKRKPREVIGKIKKADGIIFIKDNGSSPTNGD